MKHHFVMIENIENGALRVALVDGAGRNNVQRYRWISRSRRRGAWLSKPRCLGRRERLANLPIDRETTAVCNHIEALLAVERSGVPRAH